MSRPIHILAISGSLRASSCNTGLLRAAMTKLPPNVTMEVYVPDLPVFSQDLEVEGKLPPSAAAFRAKAKTADAFLFACTEYNFSVSAPLKNAIDWASRGEHGNCFNDKPAALVGAGGGAGTLRSQQHLRDIALFLNLHVLNQPQLMLKIFEGEPKPFNLQTGDLVDEASLTRLGDVMEALVKWTHRLSSSP